MNEANWDLEPHAAYQGSVLALGAQFSVPPGIGFVDGGSIPYKPDALAKKKENFANRAKLDPEVKCYMGGVPRSTYMPYPFQIIQGSGTIMIAYEYAGGVRTINMAKPTEAPTDSWMGWSNGHWEGETLVVDTVGYNERFWISREGAPHTEALHFVEHFTRQDYDTLKYEATIDDPGAYTKPWSGGWFIRWTPGEEMYEYMCQENNRDVKHMYGGER